MQYITATIHHNLRDSESLYPKSLLTDVDGFDREHVWVDKSLVLPVRPLSNRVAYRISFTCDTKEYFSLREPGKKTLINIDNLKILYKIKKEPKPRKKTRKQRTNNRYASQH